MPAIARRLVQPWQVLDRVATSEGVLELRQRADYDFLITVGGRVLMTSRANESEIKLAEWACAGLRARKQAHVLVGGLGMGYTLRATLDQLGSDACVVIAELNAAVVRWCEGPLGPLTHAALADPRVQVFIGNVTTPIGEQAKRMLKANKAPTPERLGFDAIILDLYRGPDVASERGADPLYGEAALRRALVALRPEGVLAIWSEQQDQRFEQRLTRLGLAWSRKIAGRGGRRHVVYLCAAQVA